MDDKTKEQIRKTLGTYDTERLLEIWRSEGEAEWVDEAVEIAGEILKERLGELPPKEPNIEDDEEDDDDELDEYLDPRTYNIKGANQLASRSRALASSFLVLAILGVVLTFFTVFQQNQIWNWGTITSVLIALLIPGISCLTGYILLTAVGYGLDLLADIADNTRKSEKYLAKSMQRK